MTVEQFSSNKLDLSPTESERHTGKYLPQVVAVQTECHMVHTKITMHGKYYYSPVQLKQTRFTSNLVYYMAFGP